MEDGAGEHTDAKECEETEVEEEHYKADGVQSCAQISSSTTIAKLLSYHGICAVFLRVQLINHPLTS